VEKWQEQVEEIVRKKFPDDTAKLVKEATRVIDMAYSLDPPLGIWVR